MHRRVLRHRPRVGMRRADGQDSPRN
jgi:hypothetical protein